MIHTFTFRTLEEGTVIRNPEFNKMLSSTFRRLSLQHHPDKGGNEAEQVFLSKARDDVKRSPDLCFSHFTPFSSSKVRRICSAMADAVEEVDIVNNTSTTKKNNIVPQVISVALYFCVGNLAFIVACQVALGVYGLLCSLRACLCCFFRIVPWFGWIFFFGIKHWEREEDEDEGEEGYEREDALEEQRQYLSADVEPPVAPRLATPVSLHAFEAQKRTETLKALEEVETSPAWVQEDHLRQMNMCVRLQEGGEAVDEVLSPLLVFKNLLLSVVLCLFLCGTPRLLTTREGADGLLEGTCFDVLWLLFLISAPAFQMLRLVQVPEGEGVLGVRALSLYASQLQDLIFYVPTVVCILWGLLFSEGVNAGVHPANGLALALLTVEARGTMMPSMNFDRFLRSYTTGAYAQTLFQGLWTLLKGLCTGGPAVVTGHSVPFTMSWWLTVGILVELHFARRFLAWREWPFQIDMVGGWVGGWMRITKLGVFVLAAWVVESASLVLILITRPSAMTIAYLFGWEILCVMEHFLIFIWERIRRRTASGTPVDQRVTAGSSSSNSATRFSFTLTYTLFCAIAADWHQQYMYRCSNLRPAPR
uniref:J domain-containing protein n=1 Tax=Chromera velia CCMP2878 TaxID=1169474 RepID=A0A0K6S636_9ALVE|eukprot:Cvel_2558.t3-p1 / transcript=Cvel_2558.t3 / gene=Cvel_2558 / organism=Chromera_velia_CCMP2878 / gene_product=hypothetical protein / transcript_product=hypothetical protein / location=Cvel_scaffold101:45680-49503(+) / protein_length=590 / sequence_SO=supercontig / SO=protein_coding / is_pseudo=false